MVAFVLGSMTNIEGDHSDQLTTKEIVCITTSRHLNLENFSNLWDEEVFLESHEPTQL